MDEALNNSAQTAAPAAQPVATPAPAAQPVAAAAPAAPAYTVTPSSAASESSSGGGSLLDTLKNLNWIEIGVGILGVWGLAAFIGHYTVNKKILQPSITEMQNKIDKITIELSDVKTALESKIAQQSAATTQGFV